MDVKATISAVLHELAGKCEQLLNASDCIEQLKTDLLMGKLALRELNGFVVGLYAAGALDGDTLTRIERTIRDIERAEALALEIKPGDVIERPDDMSPDARLSVCMDYEGDIQIMVIPPQDAHSTPGHTLEYVCHCPRSRHTLEALRGLMVAMARDNREHPLPGQVTITQPA